VITALDTNVVPDVLRADQEFRRSSIAALGVAAERGSLVVCDIVWSELSSGRRVLEHLGVASRRCPPPRPSGPAVPGARIAGPGDHASG